MEAVEHIASHGDVTGQPVSRRAAHFLSLIYLTKNASMIDFILKTIPDEMKEEISIELIDEIFEFVSNSHSS